MRHRRRLGPKTTIAAAAKHRAQTGCGHGWLSWVVRLFTYRRNSTTTRLARRRPRAGPRPRGSGRLRPTTDRAGRVDADRGLRFCWPPHLGRLRSRDRWLNAQPSTTLDRFKPMPGGESRRSTDRGWSKQSYANRSLAGRGTTETISGDSVAARGRIAFTSLSARRSFRPASSSLLAEMTLVRARVGTMRCDPPRLE